MQQNISRIFSSLEKRFKISSEICTGTPICLLYSTMFCFAMFELSSLLDLGIRSKVMRD